MGQGKLANLLTEEDISARQYTAVSSHPVDSVFFNVLN